MTELDVNSENIDYLKEKSYLTKDSFHESTYNLEVRIDFIIQKLS
jgi:hypothetical protein